MWWLIDLKQNKFYFGFFLILFIIDTRVYRYQRWLELWNIGIENIIQLTMYYEITLAFYITIIHPFSWILDHGMILIFFTVKFGYDDAVWKGNVNFTINICEYRLQFLSFCSVSANDSTQKYVKQLHVTPQSRKWKENIYNPANGIG